MDIDRYLKIHSWATRRYMRDGWLTLAVGHEPTAYSRIEALAFDRYMCGKVKA